MGFYSYLEMPKIDPHAYDFVKNPDKFDGKEVVVVYADVKTASEYEAVIDSDEVEIALNGNFVTDVFSPGENISVRGIFQSPNIIFVEEYHIHLFRSLKYYLSVPVIIFLIFLLSRQFRFDLKKIQFIEKEKFHSIK
ncbi:MAG: hypothetical protein ACD_63C00024G0005 [uncultured bacterium]|nr:MAG: hypothetical protein ACD_63C00024G0005 [uncultured bacterium]